MELITVTNAKTTEANASTSAPKKGRGRPKGSKNEVVPALAQMVAPVAPAPAPVQTPPANLSLGSTLLGDMTGGVVVQGLIPAMTTPTFTRKEWDVEFLNTARNKINLDPTYQRNSGVWSVSRRRSLIATIIAGWVDIPKLYIREVVTSRGSSYEVTDGKQRLSTIYSFLDNKLKLGAEIPELEGMRFKDLPEMYRQRFLSATLDVVLLRNYDEGHIRHMFRLLQQGVKTNAQENRNASMSYVRDVIYSLSSSRVFELVNFTNHRLGYQQVASQTFLMALHDGEPTHLSKTYIDDMYDLLADETTYSDSLDAAANIVGDIFRVIEQGMDGLDSESIPNGFLSKGSFITMFSVLAYIARVKEIDFNNFDVQEFVDEYLDFYKNYEAKYETEQPYMTYYNNTGGDSTDSVLARRDAVISHMEEYLRTLPERESDNPFSIGIEYPAIRQQALEERAVRLAAREKKGDTTDEAQPSGENVQGQAADPEDDKEENAQA